jgi:hypothetical protein
MIKAINTLVDVAAFAKEIIKDGVSFHPDDNFNDYVNFATNEQIYTDIEAERRNVLMNQCFEVCEKEDMDIYDFMLEILLKETGMDSVIPLPSSEYKE